jgi:hypothetical protein
MTVSSILWDLEDAPAGNVQNCLAHGVTMAEIEDVVQDARSRPATSRPSGLPLLFGVTRSRRRLIVVYDQIDEDSIYPVTAHDVE